MLRPMPALVDRPLQYSSARQCAAWVRPAAQAPRAARRSLNQQSLKSNRASALPPPRQRASADYVLKLTKLQQGFVTEGWGFRVKLLGSNPEPPMSALGQKRTSHDVRAMSALPPKADIVQCGRHVRFVPKADLCTAAIFS